MNRLLSRLLGSCPLWRALLGGYRYYSTQERRYSPESFRACGEGVVISSHVDITAPDRVILGRGAYVGPKCTIYAVGGFHLGSYSGLGENCSVITVEHRHAGATSLPFEELRMVKPVWIEDYVWIGMNVSILPGVRIGEGAIVGLGSVLLGDVQPLAIVAGNPAEVVGHRDRSAFERLKASGAFRRPSERSSALWIPPLTRRKYHAELPQLGFDGAEYLQYEPRPEEARRR